MKLNQLMISGRLGDDAKINTTSSGSTYRTFSVAVDDSYKKEGATEWTDKTYWVNVTQWGKAEYLKVIAKGSFVLVQGKLTITKKEDKYYTNVVANKVQVVNIAKKGEVAVAVASGELPNADNEPLPF